MYNANADVARTETRSGGSQPAEVLGHPSAVRYIKLGQGGVWADQAFAEGIIPFGYSQVTHAPCAAGDWEAVRAELVLAGRSPSGATSGMRELREFYEAGDDWLWVTFADGHLWWAFARRPVIPVDGPQIGAPSRLRETRDGWHRESLTGERLSVRSLSSALTRVAGYRGTLCAVEREAYLLRRIRGEEEPLHHEATLLKASLANLTQRMIAGLDWRDFEVMVDLILTRGGWQRRSAVGEGEVDIDLMLDNPSTGESAWVQVKSRAAQAVLDDYLARFRRDGSCDRFYFVCHTAPASLVIPNERGLHLWAGDTLASHALAAGLLDWLIERTR